MVKLKGQIQEFVKRMQLSENIISTFNNIFWNIDWQDKDNVVRKIKELPKMAMKNKE